MSLVDVVRAEFLRGRNLEYVRAARALGDLRMHANQVTLDQAAEFACANTPRGWLRLEGETVRGEQHLYLQQPAYVLSEITRFVAPLALVG